MRAHSSPRRLVSAAVLLITIFLARSSARAQGEPEFGLSLGYSHDTLDSKNTGFNEQDGSRFEMRFSGAPIRDTPEFRLGIGVGFSYYEQDYGEGDAFKINDQVIILTGSTFEQLSLIEPEIQVSWRQPFTDWLWVEPGIGVGGVIGEYRTGKLFGGTFFEPSSEDWDANFAVRPFMRVAFHHEALSVGAEASYLWCGNLDFTHDVHGELKELYVGAFLSISF
jgi:hypothetical protein